MIIGLAIGIGNLGVITGGIVGAKKGGFSVLGEVLNQYAGIAPDDRMEPYWKMAEELDIPVGYTSAVAVQAKFTSETINIIRSEE